MPWRSGCAAPFPPFRAAGPQRGPGRPVQGGEENVYARNMTNRWYAYFVSALEGPATK